MFTVIVTSRITTASLTIIVLVVIAVVIAQIFGLHKTVGLTRIFERTKLIIHRRLAFRVEDGFLLAVRRHCGGAGGGGVHFFGVVPMLLLLWLFVFVFVAYTFVLLFVFGCARALA